MGNVGKALAAPLSSPKEALKALNPVYTIKKYGDLQAEDKQKAEEQAAKIAEENSPYNLGRQALEAQIALAPDQYNMESKYRPLYAQLDTKILNDTLLGGTTTAPSQFHMQEYNRMRAAGDTRTYDQWWNDHAAATGTNPEEGYTTQNTGGVIDIMRQATPLLGDIQTAANSQARAADLADVQNLGTGYASAIRAANPQLTAVQDKLYDRAVNGSDIMRTMESQTLADLQKGGYLNPDELRQVQQGVRSAYGARGLSGSSAAAMAEALQRTKYVDARKSDAQGRALTVDTARDNLIGNTGKLLASTSVDPVQAILGRNSTATGAASTALGQSAFGQSATPTIFDPYDSQIMNIFSGNQATQLAYLTNANNNATAQDGAALSFAGNMAGGIMGAF